MGLVSEGAGDDLLMPGKGEVGDRYVVLTDILGLEDGMGDMDLKA